MSVSHNAYFQLHSVIIRGCSRQFRAEELSQGLFTHVTVPVSSSRLCPGKRDGVFTGHKSQLNIQSYFCPRQVTFVDIDDID